MNGGLFDETVAAHIEAIESRDLDALLATITGGDRLTLIFPDATTTHTRREYVDFHREWFADEGWTMEFEPVSSLVHGDLGIALVRTTYTDATGSRGTVLALTFHRENAGWRLVFDQNTRIPAE
ncbi:MAG: YybH family protein [Gammaproteobacteria bacterium]